MAKGSPKSYTVKLNLWAAIRDVFIAALARGQFLAALGGMVIVVIVLKMPEEDVSKLAFNFLNLLERKYIYGYLSSGVLSVLWFLHSRYQQRFFQKEIDRAVSEKSDLQGILLGKQKIESSKP